MATTPDAAFGGWARARQQHTESVLERRLAGEVPGGERLAEAMRYAVLGGGKRVRALLAYAAGELAGAEQARVDAAAAALEMVHAYSLVHDDLPCMDDDDMRRGRPSCHVAFGEATALLAGDALQALAFRQLADLPDPGRALATLADAAGVLGMVAGQQIDLDATGRTQAVGALEAMHRLKTGALIRAAVLLGAQAGSAAPGPAACAAQGDGPREAALEAALERYAAAVGLAFQVVDDILDAEASTESLGKTAGKDAADGKSTYVTAWGLDAARARAQALRADAHRALEPFGAPARRLGDIADWIVERRS